MIWIVVSWPQFCIGPGSGGGVTNDIVKRISITCPTAAFAFETAGLCLVALNSSGSTESQLRSQKLIGQERNADWLATALFSHWNIFLLKPCKILLTMFDILTWLWNHSVFFFCPQNQPSWDSNWPMCNWYQFPDICLWSIRGSWGAKDGDGWVGQQVQHPTIEISLRKRKLDDDA
jgi:hypothetical protein